MKTITQQLLPVAFLAAKARSAIESFRVEIKVGLQIGCRELNAHLGGPADGLMREVRCKATSQRTHNN